MAKKNFREDPLEVEQKLANDDVNQSKWINNSGEDVQQVFGFNSSAELVNGRAAMVGFIMLILTELVFSGRPVTSSIFGIN